MKLSRSIVERAPVTDVYVIFRQKLWGPVNEVKIPKLTFEFYIKKKKHHKQTLFSWKREIISIAMQKKSSLLNTPDKELWLILNSGR